MSKFEREGNKD